MNIDSGMDKQSPHLLLRVPTPGRDKLSFCAAAPREMKRWIADLPRANIGETARLLYQALTELNQLLTPSANRLQLLELLRPEIHFVCRHLERHFLSQPIVLDERPRKVANLCQALQSHLAIGYKLVVVRQVPPASKDRAQLLAIALQRASQALYGPLVRATQLYCPVPEGLWLELHQLYRIGRQHGLHQVRVSDELIRQGKQQTLEQVYLSALLLGCARCNQMRQSGIARLVEALENWSHRARLLRADDNACLFAIAPQLDGPPRYKSLFDNAELANLLGLDPTPLVDAIRETLQEGGQPVAGFTVPEGMPADLLLHLGSAWGDIAERTFQRTPGNGSLFLCIGMSALHFNLAGERSFSDVLKRPEEQRNARFNVTDTRSAGQPDIWANAFDAKRESHWEHGIPMEEIQYRNPHKPAPTEVEDNAEAYPTYQLPIINHSPGGYCLSWPREVPGQLLAGEILGIQDAPGQAWSVAVVRWIRQVRGGGTQMGIELIAPQAQPCGVQLVRKNEQGSHYLRALLLPEVRVISRPATLITPRLPFQESHKIMINCNGDETRVILSRKQTSTGSFSQFEYRVLEQAASTNTTPVTTRKSPGQAGEEDFDSLWKSL